MRSIIIAAALSCACLPGDPVPDLVSSSDSAYPVSNRSTKSARLKFTPDFAAADVFASSQSFRLASADPNAIATFGRTEEPGTTGSLPARSSELLDQVDPLIDRTIDRMVTLPRVPADPDLAPPISNEALCGTLADAAQDNKLPLLFFNNLIWQESRFKTRAVSPVGAQGVAQFMPYVAASVGLSNPFDAFQALPASARLLKTLHEQFGNLGLAAAAYNVGPKRVVDWLSKRSRLPAETRNYVQVITGRPPEHWRARAQTAAYRLPVAAPCREMPTFAQAEEEARRQEEARKAADAEKARIAKATKRARPHGPKAATPQLASAQKEPLRLASAKDQSKLDTKPVEATPTAKPTGKAMRLVAKLAASKPVRIVAKKIAPKAQPAKKIHTASLKR